MGLVCPGQNCHFYEWQSEFHIANIPFAVTLAKTSNARRILRLILLAKLTVAQPNSFTEHEVDRLLRLWKPRADSVGAPVAHWPVLWQ